MDDYLISRRAAIEAINRIAPVDTEYDCTLLARFDVRQVLTDLPSAKQWIPVSERLPEDGADVLAVMEYSHGNRSMWVVHGVNTKAIFDFDNVWRNGVAIAWMPLPEPYKEKEDKENEMQ